MIGSGISKGDGDSSVSHEAVPGPSNQIDVDLKEDGVDIRMLNENE